MREIEDPRINKNTPEYRGPGGPAKEPSARRGFKQRWTISTGSEIHRTRRAALREAIRIHGHSTKVTAQRVFV